jgi:hypothetical protein
LLGYGWVVLLIALALAWALAALIGWGYTGSSFVDDGPTCYVADPAFAWSQAGIAAAGIAALVAAAVGIVRRARLQTVLAAHCTALLLVAGWVGIVASYDGGESYSVSDADDCPPRADR